MRKKPPLIIAIVFSTFIIGVGAASYLFIKKKQDSYVKSTQTCTTIGKTGFTPHYPELFKVNLDDKDTYKTKDTIQVSSNRKIKDTKWEATVELPSDNYEFKNITTDLILADTLKLKSHLPIEACFKSSDYNTASYNVVAPYCTNYCDKNTYSVLFTKMDSRRMAVFITKQDKL